MTLRFSLLIGIVLIITACEESQYIPSKAEGLTHGFYEEFSEKLNVAYNNEDDFEVGIQLANLKAPTDKVFHYLNKGINETPDKCLRLYPPLEALRAVGIKTNIVRIDTTEFLNSIDLCLSKLGQDSYNNYLKENERLANIRNAEREQLDSLLFDHALIAELDQIRSDDQKIRMKMAKDDIYEGTPKYDSLNNLQTMFDSINLIKVDDIFKKYGWPSQETIGYDNNTIWLVLQHQEDIYIRDKYQELVEANAGPGSIEAYLWASSKIRRDMRN